MVHNCLPLAPFEKLFFRLVIILILVLIFMILQRHLLDFNWLSRSFYACLGCSFCFISGWLSFILSWFQSKLFFEYFLKGSSFFYRNVIKYIFIVRRKGLEFLFLLRWIDWICFCSFFLFLCFFLFRLQLGWLGNEVLIVICVNLLLVLHRLDWPLIFEYSPTLVTIHVLFGGLGVFLFLCDLLFCIIFLQSSRGCFWLNCNWLIIWLLLTRVYCIFQIYLFLALHLFAIEVILANLHLLLVLVLVQALRVHGILVVVLIQQIALKLKILVYWRLSQWILILI